MRKIDQIAQLRESFLQQVQQARASGLLPALIDFVFDRLVISIPQAAERLQITYRAAKHNVERLAQFGILSRPPVPIRPKLFVCRPLVNLIFEADLRERTSEPDRSDQAVTGDRGDQTVTAGEEQDVF